MLPVNARVHRKSIGVHEELREERCNGPQQNECPEYTFYDKEDDDCSTDESDREYEHQESEGDD